MDAKKDPPMDEQTIQFVKLSLLKYPAIPELYAVLLEVFTTEVLDGPAVLKAVDKIGGTPQEAPLICDLIVACRFVLLEGYLKLCSKWQSRASSREIMTIFWEHCCPDQHAARVFALLETYDCLCADFEVPAKFQDWEFARLYNDWKNPSTND